MKNIRKSNRGFLVTFLTILCFAPASSALALSSGVQIGTAVTEADTPVDASTFSPCDQEMTTCPCNGVRVEKDVVKSGDVLMLRLKDTSVVSFPLRVE